jgi:hypothetical protein
MELAMGNNNKCIWCNREIEKRYNHGPYICFCPNCGKYEISLEAFEDVPGEFNKRKYRGKGYLFSGYIREMNDLHLKIELITNVNFQNILHSPLIPKTSMEKLDKLLLHIYRNTDKLFQLIEISQNTPSIGYAKDAEELSNMLIALQDLKYLDLKSESPDEYVLTLEGIQRAESLQKEVINTKQCFVAMWFDPSMMDIYNRYITKAAQDTGYESLTIGQKEHTDKICDQIISEIRRSKFLIADFTGHRGGVYFEAGFALGLGLPVIWTCKKDDLENLHFDIRQYNFIAWETGEELRERLTNRIRATIL